MSAKCECPECGNIHRLNGVAGPEKPGRLAEAEADLKLHKKLLNAALDLLTDGSGMKRTDHIEKVNRRALEAEIECLRRWEGVK